MFSGIIEHQGRITAARRQERDLDITVATGIPDLALGESIAVNGVCLTVTSFDAAGTATFFISSETLDRTALGRIATGHTVNLERAVTPTTRLSGHIVQGHVDGTGRLAAVRQAGEARHITFTVPAASNDVTVRHTPLTAMLSPRVRSVMPVATVMSRSRSSRRAALTCPWCSMMPENMLIPSRRKIRAAGAAVSRPPRARGCRSGPCHRRLW